MASDQLVWVPVESLWDWFDVAAYIEAVIKAQTEIMRRAMIESGGYPHAAGESVSMGLFQQSGVGWGGYG